jgi:hypothetical protein
MNVAEWIGAAVFGVLGLRSLVHWLRHPLVAEERRERLLFALFVMSRSGLWFALAGLFALYAGIDAQGRAFADLGGDLRWYFFVLALPAAGQFVSGFLLGRPSHRPDDDAR